MYTTLPTLDFWKFAPTILICKYGTYYSNLPKPRYGPQASRCSMWEQHLQKFLIALIPACQRHNSSIHHQNNKISPKYNVWFIRGDFKWGQSLPLPLLPSQLNTMKKSITVFLCNKVLSNHIYGDSLHAREQNGDTSIAMATTAIVITRF